ncbi:2,3-dihydroxyphenylpropionate 1,2-dioxygenase [Nocardioides luteus]|uniref:2,3-dihydroxyphenylpropionate/2,3-dihydroxicinnamic acid 1,2-dioxygenase n=1 Tax=Nocardioides luteus TaxID=1844 RepID=A0ABQ5SZL2_9ACTN|nr:3-carboxyethylcatechol 2,3-dioxygenase [Nocardioides luteus]MDR7312756.1 2,3-dihydroxyphenylpropionate 1,2-dioxygenase [Nocardioides luteus]GGR47330.1 2,3-dihydroxyphenylpropionate/2,3-dihydroxicinnamic acid 1,2-dioxygenase [Nocardioides luteus]GLJ69008.1 2,3-dihydroxyphenylpropionate/2,3-dihydroxicinnam ic acid 1,2-dioxygenase [Nocardioides luteus]
MASQVALCCMSHSPLLHRADPGAETRKAVDTALAEARAFVDEFDPELVVIFGPDHYAGFRYRLMPPFCIGASASAIGDYGTESGPLDVPQHVADDLVGSVLEAELDVAMSERMTIDHGISQPLEVLLGSIGARPVVPIFINSVAAPLGPMRRARLLGEAVGEFVATLDKRVLIVGSGGLSHDPPVPKLRTAEAEVAEYLIDKQRTPAEQQRREQQVYDAGQEFAQGASGLKPLNPNLDNEILDLLAAGDLHRFDEFTVEWLDAHGGGSVHEVRTWVAAHAALAATGPYRTTSTFYEPVPAWIVGFAVTTAVST